MLGGVKRAMTSRWVVLAFGVLALNFAWEMAQMGFFADMMELPFWSATARCFRAALGDAVIAAAAFIAAAAVAGRVDWPIGNRLTRPLLIFLTIGLAVTIGVEVSALATGRWSYNARMPRIGWVGVTPLLQWLLLPLLEIVAFRRILRAGASASLPEP